MKVLKNWIAAVILTLVSGLYIVISSGEFRFGFPFHWLTARIIGVEASWSFNFLWSWFIVDLAIYALLVTAATWIYEKKLKLVSNRNIYRISFLLLYVILVICCWVFIILLSSTDFGLLRPGRSLTELEIYFGIRSWLRFLLGLVTIILTWFLIKYFKRVPTP